MIRELLEIQERNGWLDADTLRNLARERGAPLYALEGLTSFYTHFRRSPPPAQEIEVCRDLSCQLAGGRESLAALRKSLEGRDDVVVREVSCLGRCDAAPAAALGGVALELADTGRVLDALENGASAPTHAASNWGKADPYANSSDRYGGLKAALQEAPARLPEKLEAAGLRGMGGAAFPTGRKWSLVAAAPEGPRHVIANADESEPGAFKDREILHDLPHLLVEGMALAGYAIAADRGTIFIRHEYEPERRALEAALDQAREAGALGQNIFGSGFDFEIEIFVSPGGYILGEETALLECLEDRRGEPRNKPPFPGVSGLFGQPTLINNVETFAHAAAILYHGPEWWHDLGRPGFSGHKFMSVSGDVERPGVHLVAFGTPLGELLDLSGGMREQRGLLALAPGGASSRFLAADALEIPIDFQTFSDAGSMLGAGAVVFIAEDQDLLEAGLSVTRFFRNESCGKCVPCRVGTEKAVKLVEAAGGIDEQSLAKLADLHATLARSSICGLGQIALDPMLSLAERFPERMRGE
ncbi:MAG: NAD(P)H-dependent oxidoreductase subunit E [Myxococcota bacterium]|nr:NAD(P)H-dependent oxidoreductase subunit E [Myxococcota bacterium]